MAPSDNRIYRRRRPVRTALTVIATLAAVLLVLAILVFFWFRKYIVYTSGSVELVVPWLQEAEQDPEPPEPS